MNDDDMPDVRTVMDAYNRYGLRHEVNLNSAVARVILQLENDRAMLLLACEAAEIYFRASILNTEEAAIARQLRAAIAAVKERT